LLVAVLFVIAFADPKIEFFSKLKESDFGQTIL
jgi:hypothetical protein